MPLTPLGKLERALKNTFYPTPLLISAVAAGISQARNNTPGFGQGWKGYERRFGDQVGTKGTQQLVGTFLLASVLRQDPQYYSSHDRGFGLRLAHAVSRVFVARTDLGGSQFNYSGLGGRIAGVAVSNVWRAPEDRSFGKSAERFGYGLALDAVLNVFREFFNCRNAPRN